MLNLRNSVKAALISSSLCIAMPSLAASKMNFDIPAGDLAQSLTQYIEQSGNQILFQAKQIEGLKSKKLSGAIDSRDALEHLLEGSGLQVLWDESGAAVVVKKQNNNSSPTTNSQPNTHSQNRVQEEPEYERISITGSRLNNRTEMETSVPIDIFQADELTSTGRTELNQALASKVPSFNFNQTALSDGTDLVRPATLRGLQPDQTLFLLNGKRRHATALVNVNGSVGRGSAAVDLNSIPTDAIGNVQVLRDGAAAQYGSDAIAGVINVVLKEKTSGGGINVQYGQHMTDPDFTDKSFSDGETLSIGGWQGFELGDDGFLTLSAQFRDRSSTNRAGPDPRKQYPDIDDMGTPDPREVSFDRINHRYGNGDSQDISLFYNAGMNLDNGMEIYSFGSYQNRDADTAGFYRRARDSRNIIEIYPDGFLPKIGGDVTDFSAAIGVKGDFIGNWAFDTSAVYGSNTLSYSVFDSLNVSLGPSSPTSFDAGDLIYRQMTLNFDVTGELTNELSMAAGIEYRNEWYEIKAGDEASYITGEFPGAGGSQVFPGFSPESKVDVDRSNIGAYVDFEWVPTDDLFVSAALRFEDYSDFGNTVTSKLTARYDVNNKFALRGGISTGFRAPSLQQQHFTSISTVFTDNIPEEVGTYPATSGIAKALGGVQLEAEESINTSIGFVLRPIDDLYVTFDAYQIDIDDQIILTENLGGDDVATVLADAGFTGVSRVRFFQNGVETETKGIDLVAGYKMDLADAGALDLSLGYNKSEVEVTKSPENTVLPDLTLFGRSRGLTLEESAPESKLILGARHTMNDWSSSINATRYGDVVSPSNNPNNDFSIESAWIVDISANYKVSDQMSITFGIDNLLDKYPEATPDTRNFNGIFPVSTRSPYGISGRYVYGRISYSW